MTKLYIPYFIDVHLMECRIVWEKMEGSCALQLGAVLKLIIEGTTGDQWTFQTIDPCTRFINNEYPDEIMQLFDGWALITDGCIIAMDEKISGIPNLRSLEFEIGFDPAGIRVCPASAELVYNYKISGDCPAFEIEQFEDIKILKGVIK